MRTHLMQFSHRYALPLGVVGLTCLLSAFAAVQVSNHLGKQTDGSFLVSSGQRVEGDSLPFKGRPSEIALNPTGDFFAVTRALRDDGQEVFLMNSQGLIEGSSAKLPAEIGFHGLVWSPDGAKVYATLADGHIQVLKRDGMKLTADSLITLNPGDKTNPVPGGMAITKDGSRLYIAAMDLDAVVEVDTATNQPLKRFPVEKLPFDVKLTDDESTLVVTNWAGRIPKPGDEVSKSGITKVVVDERGSANSGTVSIIERGTGKTTTVAVQLHPTTIALAGNHAYIANTMSDSISDIDIKAARVSRTIPIKWDNLRVLGAMPTALAVKGDTLYSCDGGDNAVAEIDLRSGKVRGFRHAGYYPIALQLAPSGAHAYVLNSKGNGSVANTVLGKDGNAHDFQGTVSVLDLNADLKAETAKVASDNHWNTDPADYKPKLAVYNGAIKHVLYIIKENRTYDAILGDMPEGNGDPKLCILGPYMPNHQAIAREFTLFDNAYVSGTNSADGHEWATQSIADDSLEHFYVGYSRTYPDGGDDAMGIASSGCLWDNAAKKHRSVRVYGEYADYVADEAVYQPYRPKDWFEAWQDYKAGTHKFKYVAHTQIKGLRPYLCSTMHYWPLIQSDQAKADIFIDEFNEKSRKGTLPALMIMALPSDHTEGLDPNYPQPKSMMADNDLALGRIIEAVSKSPDWKSTCIFVIEDDAQSGVDHVDGHRTAYFVVSPYNKRHTVDSNLYTNTNMIRSIEVMLGLDPMNRFDALATPITACFNDTPNLAPYNHVPNTVPLGLHNPTPTTETQRYWARKSKSLDWSHADGPDAYWLDRVIWYSMTNGRPYPTGHFPQTREDD